MMSVALPLLVFLVSLLISLCVDLRNKLDVDKTREVCSCPLPLLQSTVANVDVKGKWYTTQDIEDFHPCMTRSLFGPDRFRSECRQYNSLNNVTFVVMTGSQHQKDRFKDQVLDTWATTPSIRERVVAVSDMADSSVGVITFPEVEGKSSYDDAQHRQPRFIRSYLSKHKLWPTTEWLVLVDDDTYVNVDKLRRFLDRYDSRLSLSFGYVFADGVDKDSPIAQRLKFGWFSGGGGIIMSRTVVEYLMEHLYTSKQCPFDWFNDKTIAVCTKTKPDAIHIHTGSLSAFKLDPQWNFKRTNLPILRDTLTAHLGGGYSGTQGSAAGQAPDMHPYHLCLKRADDESTEVMATC